MFNRKLLVSLATRHNRLLYYPINSPCHCFSSSSSSSSPRVVSSENAIVGEYLVNTFKLSKDRAHLLLSCRKGIKSTEKPKSVYNYLLDLGFSDAHIQSAVRLSPQIAFSNIEKTLKPKIEFFQDLGLVSSDLGKFIAKHSTLLTVSLERRLVPSVEILKEVLSDDENNKNLLRVICRCSGILSRHPDSRLMANIKYFQSCGIIGPQLSMLLKRQPRLFTMPESRVKDIVSIVVEKGFSLNTGMFVHGLHYISSVSNATFLKKMELICSFGFTEEQCMRMFRSAPCLLRTSTNKLKLVLEFYMNELKISSLVLHYRPCCLMFSLEERTIPRYRVLQALKLMKLLKKNPKFLGTLEISEKDFLDKYVYKFPDYIVDLLMVYNGVDLPSLRLFTSATLKGDKIEV